MLAPTMSGFLPKKRLHICSSGNCIGGTTLETRMSCTCSSETLAKSKSERSCRPYSPPVRSFTVWKRKDSRNVGFGARSKSPSTVLVLPTSIARSMPRVSAARECRSTKDRRSRPYRTLQWLTSPAITRVNASSFVRTISAPSSARSTASPSRTPGSISTRTRRPRAQRPRRLAPRHGGGQRDLGRTRGGDGRAKHHRERDGLAGGSEPRASAPAPSFSLQLGDHHLAVPCAQLGEAVRLVVGRGQLGVMVDDPADLRRPEER